MPIVVGDKDCFVRVATPPRPPHSLIDEAVLDSSPCSHSGAMGGGNRPGWRCL